MHTITKRTLVKLKFHGSRFCVGISLTPTKGIYVKQKNKTSFLDKYRFEDNEYALSWGNTFHLRL